VKVVVVQQSGSHSEQSDLIAGTHGACMFSFHSAPAFPEASHAMAAPRKVPTMAKNCQQRILRYILNCLQHVRGTQGTF
jgi:hypothetical protein